MRIMGGKYKGRAICMPKGIRPTQNKVRKAIFDILGDIEGLCFLELFAGSASVGLEALSRGASELTLVEHSRESLLAIKKNIQSLELAACRLYPRDTREAIINLHRDRKKFDIIFLDPPYYQSLAKKTLQTLGAYDILAPNGFVIVQHFKKDNLPEQAADLLKFKQANYGDTSLSFYRKIDPKED